MKYSWWTNPLEQFTEWSPHVIMLAGETKQKARASTTPPLPGVARVASV
jgi:hypothetical protein